MAPSNRPFTSAARWYIPAAIASAYWLLDTALDATLGVWQGDPRILIGRGAVAVVLAIAAFLLIGRRPAQESLPSRDEQDARALVSDRMRALGEMSAGLAHSLNQPLTGIRGMAEHIELALERNWELEPEKMRGKLRRIREQTDRITNIIDHVRTFAKEADVPHTSKVAINDVVQSAATLFNAQLAHNSIEIKMDLEKQLPKVHANPFSLEEVVFALVSNAREGLEPIDPSTGGTQPEIVFKTSTIQKQNETWVELIVSDNGKGMSEEVCGRAFELFYSTKAAHLGTGMGLSVSKSIVEQFGGHIELRSEPGRGTAVRVLLPAITPQENLPGANDK